VKIEIKIKFKGSIWFLIWELKKRKIILAKEENKKNKLNFDWMKLKTNENLTKKNQEKTLKIKKIKIKIEKIIHDKL